MEETTGDKAGVFFRCRVGERVYELPKLTLGEGRILRTEFGVTDYMELNTTDPEQLVGLLYLCLRRERPAAPKEELIAEVEALDFEDWVVAFAEDLEKVAAEIVREQADPTLAVEPDDSPADAVVDGSSVTIPETPGTQT